MAKIDDKIKAAEKRAAAKVRRLKKQGILTGAIDPRMGARAKKNMTAREKQNYVYRIEKFMDERYHKGAYTEVKDGIEMHTPLSNRIVSQIRYTEKKVSQYRAERFGYAGKNLDEMPSLKGDMNLHQWQLMGTRYDNKTKQYQYNPRSSISGASPQPPHHLETFNSKAAAERYLERLHRQLSPEYQQQRLDTLLDNIAARADDMDSDVLREELKSLTPQQLDLLYSRSDFLDVLFIDTPPRTNDQYRNESIEHAIILHDQEETLLELIRKMKAIK